MKCAWDDEPFAFKGKYYEVPFPMEEHHWPAHEGTRQFGATGELDEENNLRKISVVPKPYQKPDPPTFMAMTTNESSIR